MFYESTVRKTFSKWSGRTETTKIMRNKVLQIKTKRENDIKFNVFQQFKAEYYRNHLFCNQISKFVDGFNNREKQSTFQLIESF